MLYLDHAATTPLRDVAREAWLEASTAFNPGGQYSVGRAARAALEGARETIASCLGCEPIEVIFTSSGTEADNLAVQGLFAASPLRRVICSPIEHSAVREPVKALDADVTWLSIAASGHAVVDPEIFAQPAALATCMLANNETGAIQPVAELAELAAATSTPFHVDAVQAVGHIPVDFAALGVTTLAASAHKFGGPRGSGFLIAKRSPAPNPLLRGGGQERGLRSGTPDVASAVATAAALKEAVGELESEHRRLSQLRDELLRTVAQVDNVRIHTAEPALPGHAYFSVVGAEGDSLIMLLDARGVAAATGSACSNGVNRASETLLAMGVSEHDARGALRLTLGRPTENVDEFIDVFADVVKRARNAGMA
ncbi:cysteine desulfurase family protein [Staphylococcus chromogenes]|nr:cysteine desulfurase family protein [Staphylococcus chromogenes]